MKYYILYPEQEKDNINYLKQEVADSSMSTIYLKPHLSNMMVVLERLGEEEFTKRIGEPSEIIIFSEDGKIEKNVEDFIDYIYNKFDYIKVTD